MYFVINTVRCKLIVSHFITFWSFYKDRYNLESQTFHYLVLFAGHSLHQILYCNSFPHSLLQLQQILYEFAALQSLFTLSNYFLSNSFNPRCISAAYPKLNITYSISIIVLQLYCIKIQFLFRYLLTRQLIKNCSQKLVVHSSQQTVLLGMPKFYHLSSFALLLLKLTS